MERCEAPNLWGQGLWMKDLTDFMHVSIGNQYTEVER